MNVAIVVAGGKGARFGSDRPKQFLELNGIPLIIHTLRQFERSQAIAEVVVVLPVAETATFQSLLEKFELKKVVHIVAGGATRAQSVKCGLQVIEEADIVAIHDAVRPLVTPEEIDRVVQAAAASGAAILAAPLNDTIKQVVDEQVSATLPRANLRRALTPQCFRLDTLQQAYSDLPEIEASGIEVSDDSMLVERLGISVVAVEGDARNIKITTPADLAAAEALLK
jgi:2-C-methyl-D-erythritol 4-phosphate cytidylyltransferase